MPLGLAVSNLRRLEGNLQVEVELGTGASLGLTFVAFIGSFGTSRGQILVVLTKGSTQVGSNHRKVGQLHVVGYELLSHTGHIGRGVNRGGHLEVLFT